MENSQITLILSSAFLTLVCAILSSTTPSQIDEGFNFHKFQLQETLNDLNYRFNRANLKKINWTIEETITFSYFHKLN